MVYDLKYNLYLIELKNGSSTETISKVIEQVNSYADKVVKILKHIEKDFEKTFYLKLKSKKTKETYSSSTRVL